MTVDVGDIVLLLAQAALAAIWYGRTRAESLELVEAGKSWKDPRYGVWIFVGLIGAAVSWSRGRDGWVWVNSIACILVFLAQVRARLIAGPD